MEDNRLKELMVELVETGDLELDQEEDVVEDEISVDIDDAPPERPDPHLTLNYDGLVNGDSILTAFTMDQLQAELSRRRSKDSDTSAV
jgi:hypothetical protein